RKVSYIIKIPKTSNPSDSCSYSVCYCWRAGGLAAPFVEIYIYGYSVIPPLYCNPFSEGDNYTSIIFKRLVRQNPKNNDWPCPPCSLGVGAPNTRLTVSGCKDDVNPNISCGTCCYYCTTDYAVCCDDDGNKVITYISQSTVGTTSCPAGCHIGPCDAP
ncbi:MAG: hypothetical protein JST20_13485, partial [Bacteroidetes bacterium]|nr:hypothetical protein [Bacteroidota bacterium]